MTVPVRAQQGKSWGLIRLICGHICLHGSMAGLRLAAPLLALRMGYSAFAVGMLLALFSLSQVFLALPAGRYADRHGLQRPVRLGVAAASTGAALAVLWPQFWALCLGALLMGGATGAASIALQRHVGRTAQGTAELKQVFSWLAIGPAVSNFVGPVTAGLLIDHAGVWLGGAAAAVRVVMPFVASHLREWVVVSGAMVTTGLLFALYPLMVSPLSMGLCSVLLGLALGSVQPMLMSTLHQITPHALQGQALGLRLAAINLSSVLMPVLFGTVGMAVGVSVLFWSVGAAVCLGAPVAWRLRP